MTTIATTAPDLLAAIVAGTRRSVAIRRERLSEAALERRAADRLPNSDGFARALRQSQSPRVIAECKRRSPSRGILRADYRPADHARAYASGGAAALSILTEPTFFDGTLEHLAAVRAAVDVPLLRKDFIVSRYQILEAVTAGADAVLLIVGALTDVELDELLTEARVANLAALVEVHDDVELQRAVDKGAAIVGVNSRNLRTLGVDPEIHMRLAAQLPKGVVAVAESGLRTKADLDRLEGAGYSAFLVGERLITESDPGLALRRLRGTA
jgi:indole-3-glycerol phosphate synthase